MAADAPWCAGLTNDRDTIGGEVWCSTFSNDDSPISQRSMVTRPLGAWSSTTRKKCEEDTALGWQSMTWSLPGPSVAIGVPNRCGAVLSNTGSSTTVLRSCVRRHTHTHTHTFKHELAHCITGITWPVVPVSSRGQERAAICRHADSLWVNPCAHSCKNDASGTVLILHVHVVADNHIAHHDQTPVVCGGDEATVGPGDARQGTTQYSLCTRGKRVVQ